MAAPGPEGSVRSERLRWGAACAGFALALVAAYANHFHNSFHFDDSHTVEQNLFIRDLANVPRFFVDARTFSALPSNQSYRPLVTTTLAIDHRLGGLDPFWFHVDNFACFALTCALILLLFRRALDARWPALLGAALFGLHAAIAETVNYVIARSDLLSTLGAVAALVVWAGFPRARRWQLHLVPAALGILAKEQGVMVAPLLVLWIAFVEQRLSLGELLRPRRLWGALRPALPTLALCGAGAVLTLRMAPTLVPGGSSRLDYALTQPYVILHYALTFFWPAQLSADSDWAPVASPLDVRVAIGAAFLVALLWLAARASRTDRFRPAAFGLLWFLLVLLPTSSVIPLAEVTNDHRMYFPFVGLALAVGCLARALLERVPRPASLGARLAPTAIALAVLGGHAFATRARNDVWRSEETLWRDVTQKSPNNARGWMNYGLTKMAKGELDETERCYRRGLELSPSYAYLHINLAILEGERAHADLAEREFRAGIALMPGVPVFRYYYARWLRKVGRAREAVPLLREALAMSPAESSSRQLLLELLAEQGAWAELAQEAREALRIRSDEPTARALLDAALERLGGAGAAVPSTLSAEELLSQSLALYQAGQFEACIAACTRALAVRAGYAEAYNNQCAALNRLGRYAEAATACEQALRLKPDFELARNNLAEARNNLR